MTGGHGHTHGLYRPGHSVVHRLPAEVKLATTIAFVLAVVSTPRTACWAFAVDAVLVAVAARLAAVPLGVLFRRLAIEAPFVAFAVFLPLVGQAPHTHALGLTLSVPGLWAAWNILVKGTLGVAATVLLASTTSVASLLYGLDRLHAPRAFTAITGFMIRYGEVIVGEARRMRIARLSRGYDPRWIWQARAMASSAGTLFVRSFERGERIHVAMVARGFTGSLPEASDTGASGSAEVGQRRRAWTVALLFPAVAAAAALTAWIGS